MIKDKKILAIIPARGGSKGVLRKNIRDVAGKPLIAWTIEVAKKSQYIDFLMVSSEDNEIIKVSQEWGCEVPFTRPKELAEDNTPGIDPVLHALSQLPGYDYVVLLQPTSPLRDVRDIDGCIERCLLKNSDSCVSVTEAEKSPYWMYLLDDTEKIQKLINVEEGFTHRQNLPKVYSLNGAVYVAKRDILVKNRTFITSNTIGYVMPKERSIDIDTELDIEMAIFIMKRGFKQ